MVKYWKIWIEGKWRNWDGNIRRERGERKRRERKKENKE